MIEITGVCSQLPGVKRCYLPGIKVVGTCPKCEQEHTRDLKDDYLPESGTRLYFTCDNEDCGHEWEADLEVEIRLLPKAAVLRGWFWVVDFDFDCGRTGSLQGRFLLNKRGRAALQALMASRREVRFGEVLGKHSDVCGPVDDGDVTMRRIAGREAQDLLRACRAELNEHGWADLDDGYNPLATAKDNLWEEDGDTSPEGFLAYLRGEDGDEGEE